MEDFLSIAQFIIKLDTGASTRDIFKTAVQVYEDKHGEISDTQAEIFYKAFQEVA
jgi:hypothetical protein